MNDWVNCLRLVAFGQSSSQCSSSQSQSQQHVIQPTTTTSASQAAALLASNNIKRAQLTTTNNPKSGQQASFTKTPDRSVDVLLEKRTSTTTTTTNGGFKQVANLATPNSGDYVDSLNPTTSKSPIDDVGSNQPQPMTASQAAAAAASALAKTRQRQPSLLGSCKPQPPNDSPFINQTSTSHSSIVDNNSVSAVLSAIGQIDTLTPTVRGQLISTASKAMQLGPSSQQQQTVAAGRMQTTNKLPPVIQATLDEEEENMLYCSIEDNPSEHNYRVKVIETELSLRCQLKCYQLTAPLTISQQYEQIGQFSAKSGAYTGGSSNGDLPVTFYQLIIGPQELTLLNDYAAAASLKQQSILQQQQQQQGLWSWPYQCIRRYGFDKDNCFMFEAGRKCTSGPGQFIVQTPKAYQIYQDVVKFVNELRSLNNTGEPNSLIETAAPTKSITNSASPASNNLSQTNVVEEQRLKAGQSIVTQIPVTWTPNNPNMAIDQVTVSDTSSRQQFFDTLRQLDSSSSPSMTTNHIQQQTSKTCLDNKNGSNNQFRIESVDKTNNLVNSSSNTSQEIRRSRVEVQPKSSLNNSISSVTHTKGNNVVTHTTIRTSNVNHIPSRTLGDKQNMTNDSSTGSLITNLKCGDSSPNATPEETDESGYEQGDDSVEDNASATSRLARLTSSAARKRQANDSMSSSSSTTSSSGGSPGHSVSRRSTNIDGIGGANFNTQGPSKRPLLNTSSSSNNGPVQSTGTTGTAVTNLTKPLASNKIIGLHNIIANDDQHEDFEANLIRDVYSEITKLHAKFAVTSGSTEDLMSSNSSNAGSSDNCSGNSNEQDCESASSAIAEPVYSNLRAPTSSMPEQQTRRERGTRDFKLEDEENVNLKDKYNQSRPQPSYHVDHDRPPLRNSYSTLNNLDYLSSQPPHSPQPLRGQMYPTILNPIPEISEAPTSKQSHNSSVAGGRLRRMGLSTNHYVINDVQYAKISRNI